jgi:hypothetical protein
MFSLLRIIPFLFREKRHWLAMGILGLCLLIGPLYLPVINTALKGPKSITSSEFLEKYNSEGDQDLVVLTADSVSDAGIVWGILPGGPTNDPTGVYEIAQLGHRQLFVKANSLHKTTELRGLLSEIPLSVRKLIEESDDEELRAALLPFILDTSQNYLALTRIYLAIGGVLSVFSLLYLAFWAIWGRKRHSIAETETVLQ